MLMLLVRHLGLDGDGWRGADALSHDVGLLQVDDNTKLIVGVCKRGDEALGALLCEW